MQRPGLPRAIALLATLLVACDRDEHTAPGSPSPGPRAEAQEGLRAVDLAVGDSISHAVMEDGTVRIWGGVAQHASALKERPAPAALASPATLEGITEARRIWVDESGASGCVLADELGQAHCWGKHPGADGRLEPKPLTRVGEMSRASAVVLDGHRGCYVRHGTVHCAHSLRPEAREVERLPGHARDLARGSTLLCALMDRGTIGCWPRLDDGADALEAGMLEGVEAAGALAMHGDTLCWSRGNTVRCRHWPNVDGRRAPPFDVALGAFGGAPIESLHLEADRLCALGEDGAVYCNRPGTAQATRVPFSGEVVKLALALAHGCALLRSGAVECWGDNAVGQVGNGTWEPQPQPAEVLHLHARRLPEPLTETSAPRPGRASPVRPADLPAACEVAPLEVSPAVAPDGRLTIAPGWASRLDENTLRLGFADREVEPTCGVFDCPTRVDGFGLRVSLTQDPANPGFAPGTVFRRYASSDGPAQGFHLESWRWHALDYLLGSESPRGTIELVWHDDTWTCLVLDLHDAASGALVARGPLVARTNPGFGILDSPLVVMGKVPPRAAPRAVPAPSP